MFVSNLETDILVSVLPLLEINYATRLLKVQILVFIVKLFKIY